MKHILHSIAVFSAAFLLTTGSLQAQTVIAEYDGANNEFVASDWTVTGLAFTNPDKITLNQDEPGTYNFANQNGNKFSNVKITMKFSQPSTRALKAEIKGKGGASHTKSGNSDATGVPTGGENFIIFEMGNANFVELEKLVITSTYQSMGIIYLKIEGTPHAGNTAASLQKEEAILWNVVINQEYLTLDSPINGSVDIYSISGQLIGNHVIIEGENTIFHKAEGISLMILRNSNKEAVGRKKMVL